MNCSEQKSFILDNSLAALSAMMKDNNIYATDGTEYKIHIFNPDGSAKGNISSIRAYRRLRIFLPTERMTALGCCNLRRIYFLDSNFNEEGFVELDSPCESDSDCGCGCGCNCQINPENDIPNNELTDASLTCINDDFYIIGVFPKSACIYNMNGKSVAKICETECGELLTDFINPRKDFYAFSTLKGNIRTITVSENGNTQSAILGKGLNLRMLIPCGNDILGLFGQNYIYNRIIPIYRNGILSLPSGNKNLF